MHYLIMNTINIEDYKGFVYNFSEGYDIQELYLISDILITDYSSAMFDYSNLRRPIIFFAYDIENYRDSLRGFYFDFENEAPGPIVKTTDEVIFIINNIDNINNEYKSKQEVFYNKFCHIDDGSAAERITKHILK
jgi:CDP-glycerol glycerophosphotransferase